MFELYSAFSIFILRFTDVNNNNEGVLFEVLLFAIWLETQEQHLIAA